jgi:hypothetical protein
MKNQYFGDINDYQKYGLLKILSGHGDLKTGVCWMLTANDAGSDGKFITYLDDPLKWRGFDPELYDSLSQIVKFEKNRRVDQAEIQGILPNTIFYEKFLEDDGHQRQDYFLKTLRYFEGVDLIFFDPDNGLEIKSIKLGRKNSCKFLFWDEVEDTFSKGHSVLVYQHFPREERTAFIQRISEKLRSHLKVSEIFSFKTNNVVFFLAPQKNKNSYFRGQANVVARIWKNEIDFLEL